MNSLCGGYKKVTLDLKCLTHLAADNSAKHLDYLAAHLMILAQHFERNIVLYTGSTYVKMSGVWNVNHFWLIYGLFLTYLFL